MKFPIPSHLLSILDALRTAQLASGAFIHPSSEYNNNRSFDSSHEYVNPARQALVGAGLRGGDTGQVSGLPVSFKPKPGLGPKQSGANMTPLGNGVRRASTYTPDDINDNADPAISWSPPAGPPPFGGPLPTNSDVRLRDNSRCAVRTGPEAADGSSMTQGGSDPSTQSSIKRKHSATELSSLITGSATPGTRNSPEKRRRSGVLTPPNLDETDGSDGDSSGGGCVLARHEFQQVKVEMEDGELAYGSGSLLDDRPEAQGISVGDSEASLSSATTQKHTASIQASDTPTNLEIFETAFVAAETSLSGSPFPADPSSTCTDTTIYNDVDQQVVNKQSELRCQQAALYNPLADSIYAVPAGHRPLTVSIPGFAAAYAAPRSSQVFIPGINGYFNSKVEPEDLSKSGGCAVVSGSAHSDTDHGSDARSGLEQFEDLDAMLEQEAKRVDKEMAIRG